MVTSNELRQALAVVRKATEQFVREGYFERGVLTRLDKWMSGLPEEKSALSHAIAGMAARQNTGTGADINGVALDERSSPSLESLVLHYADLEKDLFPGELLNSIRHKLADHRGPRYSGPWP